MNPFTKLVIAAILFLATHYVASTPLRPRLVSLLGRNGYLVLYSAVSIATLGAMIWSYFRAPFLGLWYVAELRYLPLVVMPVALLLLTCGVLGGNPTAIGQERLLKAETPARGVLRVTRHPVMWAIALWAGAHLCARGDGAAVVFFGTFLLLAASGTVLIDRRKRAATEDWERFARVTSNVPFAAILAGRNALHVAEIGWLRTAVALGLYALLLWLHPALFGARPF